MKKGLAALSLIVVLTGCSKKEGPSPRQSAESVKPAMDSTALAVSLPLNYEQQQGKDLYDHYCAVCHGDHGEADGFNSYNLNPKPHSLADSAYVAALSDKDLHLVISEGGRGVNLSAEMPAYQGTLTRLELAYLTTYVRWLARGHATR